MFTPPGGNALCYLSLASHWTSDRPLIAIEGRAAGEDKLPESVVEIASRYVQAICDYQPQGPYLVGGWSFGGIVALEIAQQLQAAGHQVNQLVLLDVGFRYSLSLMKSAVARRCRTV